MLSNSQLQNFIKIYLKEYGIELSKDAGNEIAENLLTNIRPLFKFISQSNQNDGK